MKILGLFLALYSIGSYAEIPKMDSWRNIFVTKCLYTHLEMIKGKPNQDQSIFMTSYCLCHFETVKKEMCSGKRECSLDTISKDEAKNAEIVKTFRKTSEEIDKSKSDFCRNLAVNDIKSGKFHK